MYQHHIQLKTQEPLDNTTALLWYKTVKQYGPEGVVYNYNYNGSDVALEYGTCDDCESPHVYTVPLLRDLTTDETLFIVQAWEYQFELDFDIEISNQYNMMPAGDIENIIDDEVRQTAVADMNKWHHNRWVETKVMEGWRWGTYFSTSEKTHPALRKWDDLPESHRRTADITDAEIMEWLQKHQII